MRLTVFLLSVTFILFSSFSNENASVDKLVTITALRFDKAKTTALKNLPKQPAFTIDKRGILRPAKGYYIFFEKSDGVLAILPEKTTPNSFIGGYDEITLPDGDIVACFCDAAGDNCRFDNSDKENAFACKGSCKCMIGILFGFKNPPLEYETPGGGWFNF